MNLEDLMKAAQNVQDQLSKAQDTLDHVEVDGVAGGGLFKVKATAKGRIVKMGGQFSVAEASVYDKDGKLLASGRGVYLTAPPAPPKG